MGARPRGSRPRQAARQPPDQAQLQAWLGQVSPISYGFFTVHHGGAIPVDGTHLISTRSVITDDRTEVSLGGGGDVAVSQRDNEYPLVLLTLPSSSMVPQRPLPLASRQPAVGEAVWALCPASTQQIVPLQVVSASVSVSDDASASGGFSFAIPDALLLSGLATCPGGAVVNGDGQVLGIVVGTTARGTAAVSTSDTLSWLKSLGAASVANVTARTRQPWQGWSVDDCAWADHTLAWDAQLDGAQAAKVAAGTDARYGSGPGVVTYYRDSQAGWLTVLAEVRGRCATPAQAGAPTAGQRSSAQAAFARAIGAHRADAAEHSSDAGWDEMWEGYYSRLAALFAVAS